MKACKKYLLLFFISTPLVGGREMPTSTSCAVTVDYLLSKNLVSSYLSPDAKKVLNLANRSLSSLQGIEKLDLDEYDQLNLSANCLKNLDQLRFISSKKLSLIIIQQNKHDLDISAETLLALNDNNPALKELNLIDTKLPRNILKILKDTSIFLKYTITFCS